MWLDNSKDTEQQKKLWEIFGQSSQFEDFRQVYSFIHPKARIAATFLKSHLTFLQ